MNFNLDNIVDTKLKNFIENFICVACLMINTDNFDCQSCCAVVCNKCYINITSLKNNCPVCKFDISKTYNKNYLIKNILKTIDFYCEFKDKGCDVNINVSNYSNHMDTCLGYNNYCENCNNYYIKLETHNCISFLKDNINYINNTLKDKIKYQNNHYKCKKDHDIVFINYLNNRDLIRNAYSIACDLCRNLFSEGIYRCLSKDCDEDYCEKCFISLLDKNKF